MKAIRDEVKAAAAEPAATPPHSKWGPAGSSTRFSESNASNSPKKVRFEDRCDAIMANLGEGLSPKEHLEKVKTTLAIAAVPDTWYTEISLTAEVAQFLLYSMHQGCSDRLGSIYKMPR